MSKTKHVIKTETFWKVRKVCVEGSSCQGQVCYLEQVYDYRIPEDKRKYEWDHGTVAGMSGHEFPTEKEAKNKLRLKWVRRDKNFMRDGKPVFSIQVIKCERYTVATEEIIYPLSAIPVLDRLAII